MKITAFNLKKVYENPMKVPFKPVTEMRLKDTVENKDSSEKRKTF